MLQSWEFCWAYRLMQSRIAVFVIIESLLIDLSIDLDVLGGLVGFIDLKLVALMVSWVCLSIRKWCALISFLQVEAEEDNDIYSLIVCEVGAEVVAAFFIVKELLFVFGDMRLCALVINLYFTAVPTTIHLAWEGCYHYLAHVASFQFWSRLREGKGVKGYSP